MSVCGHCGVKGVFDPSSAEEYHATFIKPGGNYWCYGIYGGYSYNPDGEPKTPEQCEERVPKMKAFWRGEGELPA